MDEQEDKKSYRSIIKSTAIFGSVQVFQTLISIVRVKFIAVLLGPAGVGLSTLFQSTTTLINQITGLGINYSSVRDVSQAYNDGEIEKISRTIIIVKRCLLVTGLIGAVFTLLFAPLLSKWTFGNSEYTWSFIWLSVTLFLNTVSSGLNAILQGARRLQDLAKSSVIGSTAGLISAIPLFYFWGTRGIVPSIIITAVTTFLFSYYFIKKVDVVPVTVSIKQTVSEIKSMIKIGVALVFTGLITSLVAYVMNLYISRNGGTEMVGLYQAGWGLTTQYVGLIFAAMGTDYFPRLSAVNKDNFKVKEIVNQQAEIALLIMTPILLVLITSTPLVIHILLSSKFVPVMGLIQYVVLGMLLKATSWSLAFIILAKGDTKMFFYTELTANVMLLVFNIIGYHYLGLKGIGIAFIFVYISYTLLIYTIVYKKYNFRFSANFLRNFLVQESMCLIAFVIVTFVGYNFWSYLFNVILILLSIGYSYKELDKRMGIQELIKSKFSKTKDED